MPTKYEQDATKRDKSPDETDRLIASILVEMPSITDEDLSRRLGLSRQTTNRRRRSKTVQDLIAEAISLPSKELRRLIAKGMRRIEALLENSDPRVQLGAANCLIRLTSDHFKHRIAEDMADEEGDITYVTHWGTTERETESSD